ncbi:hypothetical protein KUV46_10190 [Thalassovita mediterranea]|nr:hypothetical protein KUV46_10190 [Thalassovita mediterranea]
MHKYEHKNIATKIIDLDSVPEEPGEFSKWIQAKSHLKFLQANAGDDEFIVYASGPATYINTILIPRSTVEPPDIKDLMRWNGCNPFRSRSSYVSGGDIKGTTIEDGLWGSGTRSLDCGKLLFYIRSFNGWTGLKNTSVEALQEFIHIQGLHWVEEQSAYCRLDDQGELEPVFSITTRSRAQDVSLASLDRETLDEYLSIANLAAVRVFEFMLVGGAFTYWTDYDTNEYTDYQGSWYRQKLMPGHAGLTRGIQIVQPFDNYAPRSLWYSDRKKSSKNDFVDFLIFDWRNERMVQVSTDPAETTNYFEAEGNNLPFDISPVFFDPEVLSKYKADKDRYEIETRRLTCRGAWELRTYDVNEAGQVHTYICYLRDLPIREQLHWAQFNEKPKASISERAYTTDIEGKFSDIIDPLDQLRGLLRRWYEGEVSWWKLADEESIRRVCTPLTSSRDEWAEAFLDLNKLVNEGFVVKAIRSELNRRGIDFDKKDRSLNLLERLWAADDPADHGVFSNLKSIAHIRSKTKGHAGTKDAKVLAAAAIQEHGSFRQHFNAVCIATVSELELIERLFKDGS